MQLSVIKVYICENRWHKMTVKYLFSSFDHVFFEIIFFHGLKKQMYVCFYQMVFIETADNLNPAIFENGSNLSSVSKLTLDSLK